MAQVFLDLAKSCDCVRVRVCLSLLVVTMMGAPAQPPSLLEGSKSFSLRSLYLRKSAISMLSPRDILFTNWMCYGSLAARTCSVSFIQRAVTSSSHARRKLAGELAVLLRGGHERLWRIGIPSSEAWLGRGVSFCLGFRLFEALSLLFKVAVMNDHFHHCFGEESARHGWVLGEVASNEEWESTERLILARSLAQLTVKSGKDHGRNIGELIHDDKQQLADVQGLTEIFELLVSERVD